MGRANLGALIGAVDHQPTPPPPPRPEREFALSKPATKGIQPGSSSVDESTSKATESAAVATGPAGYLSFVRKETRLREDQQNALTQNARRLNRARKPGSPRITDNTLIRIAVDLLLDRIDDAAGDDEAAILARLRN